jgi:hypothetical protein
MWVFTRYGFYSIACAAQADGSPDPDTVMVRARAEEHLRALQMRFPDLAAAGIVTSPDQDYRYRIFLPKRVWAGVLSELAMEQKWSNFKNEVAAYNAPNGKEYVDAVFDVFARMALL